ncbi:hypothetical protein MiYa_04254 [Microcystis aeruginosa NIES-2519]|jgi:hypothetical protein|uniref:Uncharacterized protein n=2 Tax=Microcystis aeruginosa TaxID=1126 RepID=A0A5A5RHU8_MICAE|nr:hypothetical protein [Microcystis aeruginosa]WOB66921.1 hypothetical protein PJW00_14960 [Microcystis aeruginosa LE3]GBD51005.1 hypothetical protein BGM30_00980 [Microcystis aeruginosa NIES-298]GBE96610.1 hypothetical protein NIES298_08600 [Microcystis aeruginosa NIES-298]GCA72701.1 hypothetical protein MiYa_04254 [Microcystis aeruginosa NIES-2519]GCA91157.1 hypothetical protein MiTa_04525 [Microcystis aeruginosa NIES-4264]
MNLKTKIKSKLLLQTSYLSKLSVLMVISFCYAIIAVKILVYDKASVYALPITIDLKENNKKQNTSERPRLVLTRNNRVAEYEGVLIAPGNGQQNYDVVDIDTRDFTEGGTLRIDVQVGSGKSNASFDIFPQDAVVPIAGRPTESIAGSYDVSRNSGTSLTYQFDRGEIFQFGATGNWFSEKGSRNSYRMKAYVIPKQRY